MKYFQKLGLLFVFLCSQSFGALDLDDSERHHLVLVVGPARSGTSTVTAAVHACGCALSPEAADQKTRLQGNTESADGALNPKGTLEGGIFIRIGRDYMHRTQQRKRPLPAEHPDMLKGRQNIGKFYLQLFNGTRHAVLKHPLLSQFGPILERRATQEDTGAAHLDIKITYVVALRHPADVALSMQKAYEATNPNATVESYMEKWEENLKEALASSDTESTRTITDGAEEVTLPPAHKRVFVKYEDIMERPDETLALLAQRLGTALHPEALEAFKSQFLLPGQRTNKTPFTEDHPTYPMTPSQRALRDQLEALFQAQQTS